MKRDALRSAELINRKQLQGKTVDSYAQEFETLYLKSYGSRGGMDTESKENCLKEIYLCRVCH